MLMPTLSVTAIGVLVAVAAMTIRRSSPGHAFLLGVVGAWIGFALGAVAGMLVDVVAGTGWVLALSGHVAACAVAVGLAFSRRRLPPSRTGTATGSSAR